MPNGAEFPRAPNAERRQMPKGAKIPRAERPTATKGAAAVIAVCRCGVRNFAPFGIQRRLEFSAVWNSAPLAFRALTRSFGRR
jgi:hypothetical protein